MADELKGQILDYLRSHNTMTLATCAGDAPWAATVFFASDDLQLYFFSAPDSRHCQNLAAKLKGRGHDSGRLPRLARDQGDSTRRPGRARRRRPGKSQGDGRLRA